MTDPRSSREVRIKAPFFILVEPSQSRGEKELGHLGSVDIKLPRAAEGATTFSWGYEQASENKGGENMTIVYRALRSFIIQVGSQGRLFAMGVGGTLRSGC